MTRSSILVAAFIAAISLVGSFRALAQQQEDTSKPKPAGNAIPPIEGSGDQDADADQQPAVTLTPDRHPLTGAEIPTIGSQEMRHSYWVPGFQYSNVTRSSTLSQPTTPNWNTTNYVAGSFSLLETWSRSQLSVNYSGGGFLSTDDFQGSGYFHQLGLVQAFRWQRWQVSFIDQFSYLPQSEFGFGAATNLATPGIGGSLAPSWPGLQTSYQPNQTILASRGPRYSNSLTTQAVYAASPRVSLTFAGSYGALRFAEAGNISTNDFIFSTGYDYALSKKDTIGVLYRFSGFRFIGDTQSINDHVTQLAYGRKITGRLALQLFGGPEVTILRFATKISASGGGNLSYVRAKDSVTLAFQHGVTGGSGLFNGANTDEVHSVINRQLTRAWQGNVTVGFARNTSLGTSNSVSPTYDSWFAGGGLDRHLGRTASFTLGYAAYFEKSNVPICGVAACGGKSYVQHQISAGFQWHTRPFVLR
jgi:hypothetical protein